MADWMSGASGAASGAGTGAAIGSAVLPGPGSAIGAAAGGLIGGIGGLFGGGDDKAERRRQKMIEENRNLMNMLQGEYREAQDQGVTDTQLYSQGMAQAREQAEQQATTDSAQAAARGLAGSEYELAQDANRQRSMASTQRNLLTQSEQIQNRNERQALNAYLDSRGMLNNAMGASAQAASRRSARQQQGLQNTFSNLTQVAGMFADSSG